MPRAAVIALLALAALGVGAWLWLQTPVQSRPGSPAPVVEVVEDAPPPVPVAAVAPRPPPSVPPVTPLPERAAATPDAGAVDAALAVIDRYALGTHTVRLRTPPGEPPMELVVAPVLIAQHPDTLRDIRLRRRQLIRMIYFLGSHRAADGAAGVDGEGRFRIDLLDRFRNVIRSGKIDDLEFSTYRVQGVSDPDEGPVDEQ